MSNLIGLVGIVVILGIAFLFSSNRKAINLRIVGAAFALQVVIATVVLYWEAGRRGIESLSAAVMAVIGFSQAGIDMVFGPLASADVVGFSFAVNVLPIIIFFSALMSVLYHLRVMEWIVKLVGGTDAFIRRPFLYEGLWYGLLGAAIALLLVLLSLSLLDGPVQRLAGLYESDFSLGVLDPLSLFGVALGGPLLGLVGAWLAVGRHLAEIQPE